MSSKRVSVEVAVGQTQCSQLADGDVIPFPKLRDDCP